MPTEPIRSIWYKSGSAISTKKKKTSKIIQANGIIHGFQKPQLDSKTIPKSILLVRRLMLISADVVNIRFSEAIHFKARLFRKSRLENIEDPLPICAGNAIITVTT